MSFEKREPFFKPDEWDALAVFRPREWRGRWSAEPIGSKVLAGILVALVAYGVYDVARGGTGAGWFIIAVVVGLVLIFCVVVTLLHLTVATFRWVFRLTGVTVWWQRAREKVLAVVQVLFWVGVAAWILARSWPYLSTDPTKSWYAVTQRVPVERVEVAKEPHDCEFATAPIGFKHCHYEAKVEVFNPDGTKSVLVTYSKVEE